ncbi:unnamed protein product [Parajaminaea phylloscopi]
MQESGHDDTQAQADQTDDRLAADVARVSLSGGDATSGPLLDQVSSGLAPSSDGDNTPMDQPPAAPVPAAIDLHPPPSPRKGALPLDSSSGQGSDWISPAEVAPPQAGTESSHYDGSDETLPLEGHGPSIENTAIKSDPVPQSSLFVDLGAPAPEEGLTESTFAAPDDGPHTAESEQEPPRAEEPSDVPAAYSSATNVSLPIVATDAELRSTASPNLKRNSAGETIRLDEAVESRETAARRDTDEQPEFTQNLEHSIPTDVAGIQQVETTPPGQPEPIDLEGEFYHVGHADDQKPLEHQEANAQHSEALSDAQQGLAQPTGVEAGSIADQIRQINQFGIAKPKTRQYGFPAHADSDSLAKELDEFYSYVEAPQVLENKAAWNEWFANVLQRETADGAGGSTDVGSQTEHPAWTALPTSARRRYVVELLGALTSKDPDQRLLSSRACLYVLQGNFADTHGPEHQEHWIKLNAKMCRSEGAIAKCYEALKKALWKHDFLCVLPDHIQGSGNAANQRGGAADTSGQSDAPLLTPQTKAEYMEEVNLELTLGFAQMYSLIETGRHDEEEGGDTMDEGAEHAVSKLSEELMSLDPPLPIHLFRVLAGLREKNARGFPVKKLLLCLWKTLLACLGGQKDIERCKAMARRVEGLPPNPTSGMPSNTLWPSPPPQQQKLSSDGVDGGSTEAPDAATSASLHHNDKEVLSRDSAHVLGQASSGRVRLELGKPVARKPTKATPMDLETFQEELAVKYPTYIPPRRGPTELPIEKLATAVNPLPPRRLALRTSAEDGGEIADSYRGNAQPGTPAPSPPPSPRPGKQKFQTDQSKPFVFPFSSKVQGDRTVPYSIDEADRLYKENMHVSSELWQMWRVKEDMGLEERGMNQAAAAQPSSSSRLASGKLRYSASLQNSSAPSRSSSHDSRGWAGLHAMSKLDTQGPSETGHESTHRSAPYPSGTPVFTPGGGSPRVASMSMSGIEADEARHRPVDPKRSFVTRGEPTHERLVEIEEQIAETIHKAESDHLLAVLDNDRFNQTLMTLYLQLADIRRLQRVDLIYRGILNSMQSGVIVLLKLLLATVTAQNTGSHGQADEFADALTPPTIEDVDILRHREITTKAISAILLLLLKWFKTSHALKFHHLSQFLVDSNCMLLVLKMFGLQEVANKVRSINEVPAYNFFNFCDQEGGTSRDNPRGGLGAADSSNPVQAQGGTEEGLGLVSGETHVQDLQRSATTGGFTGPSEAVGQSVELMTDYSFRNFFASLNFTRILQKLTKRRAHRILLLNQYKSSAILKRLLKVPHPTLQLYILKIIKGQIPFCGRKWRQSNMKVITAIYLNCRPDLRDEWLSSDVEDVVLESLPQEQALRTLVKFYVSSRFAEEHQQQQRSEAELQDPVQQQLQNRPGRPTAMSHNRSLSGAEVANELEGTPLPGTADYGREGESASQSGEAESPSTYDFFESEFLLPPLRRGRVSNGPGAAAYIPDDIVEGYLDEYEEVLSEVFGPREDSASAALPASMTGERLNPTVPSQNSESPGGSYDSLVPGSPTGSPRSPTPAIATSGALDHPGGATVAPASPHANPHLVNASPRLSPTSSGWSSGKWGLTQNGARSAWNVLGEILGEADGGGSASSSGDVSDSESISSIGELDFSHPNNALGAPNAGAAGAVRGPLEPSESDHASIPAEEGTSAWENLSPKEMRFLASQPRPPTPGSPSSSRHVRRRSSSSSRNSGDSASLGGRRSSTDLRPVLNFDDDDLLGDGEVEEEAELEEENMEPLPQPQAGGIDEVEHVFGQ